jgi:hypothetical protein
MPLDAQSKAGGHGALDGLDDAVRRKGHSRKARRYRGYRLMVGTGDRHGGHLAIVGGQPTRQL